MLYEEEREATRKKNAMLKEKKHKQAMDKVEILMFLNDACSFDDLVKMKRYIVAKKLYKNANN
ncbi:MAG: hypothetical protein ACK5KP_11190 [Paludibacteraceae bacterium]